MKNGKLGTKALFHLYGYLSNAECALDDAARILVWMGEQGEAKFLRRIIGSLNKCRVLVRDKKLEAELKERESGK